MVILRLINFRLTQIGPDCHLDSYIVVHDSEQHYMSMMGFDPGHLSQPLSFADPDLEMDRVSYRTKKGLADQTRFDFYGLPC